MVDGVSNEPVVASIPVPISVEPRVAPAGEVAEVARQADEARVAKDTAPAAKSKGDETVAAKPSIRDSIAKAREKIEAEPAKALSVAAKEAPAATAPATTAATKDTKTADPVTKDNAPARAEDGKFVSTNTAESVVAADSKVADPITKAPVPAGTLPSHTASAPPARFSAAAKEEWAALPETSRSETERAIKELTAGHEKYRVAAERDASLTEYHEMAAKGGTDVKTALSKYVGMEQLLRKDPIAGLAEIAKNTGLNLRDVAAKILNQPADQVRSESDARVAALENEIAELKRFTADTRAERAQAATNTTTEAVTKFATDPANSRFEELADDITFFLKSGRTKDLAEAYKLAERLNPAPAVTTPAAVASSAPAAVTRPTLVPAASSSDAGTKSIAGTPSSGSDPVRKQPSNSIKEAIRRAQAAAG